MAMPSMTTVETVDMTNYGGMEKVTNPIDRSRDVLIWPFNYQLSKKYVHRFPRWTHCLNIFLDLHQTRWKLAQICLSWDIWVGYIGSGIRAVLSKSSTYIIIVSYPLQTPIFLSVISILDKWKLISFLIAQVSTNIEVKFTNELLAQFILDRDFILSGKPGDENVKGKSKPNFVIFVQV